MNNRLCATILALSIAFFGVAPQVLADPTRNPPLVCAAKASCSTCPTKDGCACGCILVTLDLGATTAWTGQTPVNLRIHSSDETASLSTPAQLKVVMGWSFKAVDGGTTAGGAPQIVRFVQPEGAELVVHFQDGDSVGVPEPNNLGKSLARVRMVDAEGWATTSAPAFYDLYPGDGSVWRFLATGNTNERGALVSFTDPRGRVLTPDDFGVDIVRDVLGNIRQVKTLTRLADVRTLSPTHYAVTVYPLAEEPEQVADTGLYALPEHAPTRVLDVAQGESVKELLVGFQKGTGDMRQYRYVAVNGDWTLHQPSGLVEAQELYFTEDESGAQRLHTIRDETGKLWSRDEYNYVSAYWGYLITNRIEGIPGDATRTTSWSYYTDGPHKDLLRETVEPTGNRIVYEYDDKNRVVRESMPLVEEETLYSYEPVDPSDPPLLCDTRPRCVVRKMQGIEIQRTYYVYGTNGVDVVERVGEQGAAYGGTNVLRTVTTYYPVTGAITDGLVQSVRHEDGTIDNYAYDLTDGVWTETITHVHEQAPDIVPMRTTRSVRVRNALGQLVDSRTDLCTIGVEDLIPQADWTPIARLQYAYDIDGNEIRREDLAGRLWTAEWAGNCCGKISEKAWNGKQSLFSYDIEGRLNTVVETGINSLTTIYEYDLLGRLSSIVTTNLDSGFVMTQMSRQYDALGQTIWESNAQNPPNSIRHEARRIVSFDQFGHTNSLVFDVTGRLLMKEDWKHPPSEHYRYGVMVDGMRSIETFLGPSDTSSKTLVLNLLGQSVERCSSGINGAILRSSSKFDNYGRIVLDHNPDSISVRYEYCVGDNRTIRTQYVGNEWKRKETTAYYKVQNGNIWRVRERTARNSDVFSGILVDAFKEQVTGLSRQTLSQTEHVNENGIVDREWHVFDSDCSKETVFSTSSSWGATNRETYCYGTLLSKEDRFGNTVSNLYDVAGRIVGEFVNGSLKRSVSYSPAGRIIKESTIGEAERFFDYDQFGNMVMVSNDIGVVQINDYDQQGHLVASTGRQIPFWLKYDSMGRLISMSTRSDSHSDPKTIRFEYEGDTSLVSRKVFPDGTFVHFSYAPDGRLVSIRNARSIVKSFEYDDWGRIARICFSDNTPDQSFRYDGFDRLIEVTDGSGTTLRQFDTLGNMTNVVSRTGSLSCEYDVANRRTKVLHSRGYTATYSYHPQTGLIAESCFNQTPFRHVFSRETGVLTEILSPSFSKRELRSDNGYPIWVECNWTNSQNNVRWRLEHNSNNDAICRLFETNGILARRESFEYDDLGQLAKCMDDDNQMEFSFDMSGNPQSAIINQGRIDYESDALNRISRIIGNGDVFVPEYDADGNMILTKTETGIWNVLYDANNRPVSWSNDLVEVRLDYDYLGRCVERQVFSNSLEISHSLVAYDGFNPICWIDMGCGNMGTNDTFVFWDPSQQIGERPIAEASNGILSFYLVDSEKNVRGMVSPQLQQEQWIDYGPFGNPREKGSGACPYLAYSSEPWDPVLGVSCFNFRVYNPLLMRWLQRDPVAESGGPNLYVMVNNAPIGHFDVLGLVPESYLEEITSICDRENEKTIAITTPDKKITEEAIASCTKRMNNLVENDPVIKEIMKQLPPCVSDPEQMTCDCCIFGHFGETIGRKVTLCADALDDDSIMRKTIIHEQTHVLQNCYMNKNISPSSCKTMVYTELEAYYVEDPDDLGQPPDFWNLFKKAAPSFCGHGCYTTEILRDLTAYKDWFETWHSQFGIFPREGMYDGK